MDTSRPVRDDRALLDRARRGDEQAYRDLVEIYRDELRAHCYRVLGSHHDAEDALQDALLRAWRGLGGFEGRSSVRAWLYKIATNTALDVAQHRSRRELPVWCGAPAGPGESPGPARAEAAWVEPYPDRQLAGPPASPEARYEQRESLELAFVVALQYLTPLQRAVLILREVVGFSAQEVAGHLDISVPSVTSALQRARGAARGRLPELSQQAALRALGRPRLQSLVKAYADAVERADAPALVSLLTEDATWAMPPLATWYRGREAISEFLVDFGYNERWRHVPAAANGQPALGCYTYEPTLARWVPSAVAVLAVDGDLVSQVTYFLTAELLTRWGAQGTFVGRAAFPLFGLPLELD